MNQSSKVVPLKRQHTLIQGDAMESPKDQPVVRTYGNSKVTTLPCTDPIEEQEHAQYLLHMAMWAILDEEIERGEAG